MGLPSTSRNPLGVFIHPLAMTTKMPLAAASVKKANPSSEKGMPMIGPAHSMN
jgi:hypothetical protein